MEDKRSREIQEFKQFLRESREKPDLDRYAQELFGERGISTCPHIMKPSKT